MWDGFIQDSQPEGQKSLFDDESKDAIVANAPGVSRNSDKAGSTAPPPKEEIPLGSRLVAGKVGETITLRVKLLENHTIVLAGSGSGKTVLLRRLVEEVALLGIPAIVIDAANDLATLDEKWPTPPGDWQPEDKQKAERYHKQVEVVVWTPGKESGNALALEPLPDLTAVSDDVDELEEAVAMVGGSLGLIVAPGRAQAANFKLGLLAASLRYFATHGGGRLQDFIDLLRDLPPEAGLRIDKASKLAEQMGDALTAAVATNPLLRSSGTALDPDCVVWG